MTRVTCTLFILKCTKRILLNLLSTNFEMHFRYDLVRCILTVSKHKTW